MIELLMGNNSKGIFMNLVYSLDRLIFLNKTYNRQWSVAELQSNHTIK